ncbi:MAG: TIGR01244 family sulfur transferase [Nitratireductor sp.]|jgi:sulfide:quinone oxidoreductase|nr:TIGR01244 family sulfur transferase [Nitratireductor sp.]
MNYKQLDQAVAVSGQINPGDIGQIAADGFKAVICNRPDSESWGQPSFAEIEAAARTAGIAAKYIPVTPGKTDPQMAAREFKAALDELPKPVLAYCRSGARSTMLWQMSQG